MSLTDLIARAWEQERAKYEIAPFHEMHELRWKQFSVPVWRGTREACEAELGRLCAAAGQRVLELASWQAMIAAR